MDAVEGGCWNRLASRLEKSKWFLGAAVAGVIIWLALVVSFDYNRYWGYCAKRDFNDSIGPPAHHGDRILCRVENDSAPSLPPGMLPGQLFASLERSRPAWILFGVLSCVVIAANVILIIISLPKKNEATSATGQSREFDHHLTEHGRISRIIYACTAVIIVSQSISLAKIINCRPENGTEIFYTVLLAADALVQGAFIIHEVAIRKCRGSSLSKVRRITLGFLGAQNLIMWGHSIADSVCRVEVDNAAIIGQQMWSFLDPLFGSVVAFFRILSGCLYLSFAISSDDHSHDSHSGEHYEQSQSTVEGVTDETSRLKSRGLLEFMMNSGKVSEQTLKVCHFRDRRSTYFYYSALYERKQRSSVRSVFGSLLAIPFAALPVVAYDALGRHAGIEQNTQLKYAVEITTNCVMILFCSGFLVYHGLLELLWAPNCTKCGKRQFGHKNCQACKDCNQCGKCRNCGKCGNCCKCTRLHRLKQLMKHADVETIVFFIFTFAAVAFNIMLAEAETGGDLVANILGIFSIILHALFIILTTFVHERLNLTWRGNRFHTITSIMLYLLFAVTLGSLIIDIEREHLDHDVHEIAHLRIFAPLLVDFRVHATILTYSILNEFLKQRTTVRELEDNGIFERAVCNGELLNCSMPECQCGNGTYTNEDFWKCKGADCEIVYCSDCFVNFITKVGFCPKCGNPSTGKPRKKPSAGTRQREPLADKPQKDPSAGALQQNLLAGTPQKDPLADTIQKEPSAGILQKEPSAGTLQKEPSSDTPQLDLLPGTSQKKSLGGIPQEESLSGTPQKKLSSGTPQKKLSSGTPQKKLSSGTSQKKTATAEPENEIFELADCIVMVEHDKDDQRAADSEEIA